jgi:triosephosphate isomerase
MRTPLIAGNWKMFKTVHEAVVFVKELRELVKDVRTSRSSSRRRSPRSTRCRAARNTNVGVAAQTSTGSARARSPAKCRRDGAERGAEYVIIGHSERRRLFGETDCDRQSQAARRHRRRLTPIVCIGETLEERERTRRWRCSTVRSRTASTR